MSRAVVKQSPRGDLEREIRRINHGLLAASGGIAEVCHALKRIHEGKLWKKHPDRYSNFLEFCSICFGIARSTAFAYVRAASLYSKQEIAWFGIKKLRTVMSLASEKQRRLLEEHKDKGVRALQREYDAIRKQERADREERARERRDERIELHEAICAEAGEERDPLIEVGAGALMVANETTCEVTPECEVPDDVVSIEVRLSPKQHEKLLAIAKRFDLSDSWRVGRRETSVRSGPELTLLRLLDIYPDPEEGSEPATEGEEEGASDATQ